MKLQKILYYAQLKSFNDYGEKLFDEEFEAWINGGVIRKVYENYAEFYRFSDLSSNFNPPIHIKNINHRKIIDSTIERFRIISSYDMSEKVHLENNSNNPLSDIRKGLGEYEICNKIIPKTLFKKYCKILVDW